MNVWGCQLSKIARNGAFSEIFCKGAEEASTILCQSCVDIVLQGIVKIIEVDYRAYLLGELLEKMKMLGFCQT